MPEFKAWPKIPRLFRDMVITEKIDGTNACVIVEDGKVFAQSRKRLITPADDNYGFAAWADAYADELVNALGEGYHYGEWWGSGINRGYGLKNGEKRFSLFNVNHYKDTDFSVLPNVGLVPVLRQHTFDTDVIANTVWNLKENGSQAAPGYMNPEGVVVFHSAANQVFKVTIENDSEPKGLAA